MPGSFLIAFTVLLWVAAILNPTVLSVILKVQSRILLPFLFASFLPHFSETFQYSRDLDHRWSHLAISSHPSSISDIQPILYGLFGTLFRSYSVFSLAQ